ncbi:MAG: O-antigen ligase family protein [Planctomycetes bacterium]|nr:O-antigen ligase family protein [Planctomycetota bacterium]
MTAALLVAALFVVALATQPHAFDLLALKRALLCLAAVPLLLSGPFQALLRRPLRGPLWPLLPALGVLLLAARVADEGATARAGLPDGALAWQALLQFLLFVLLALLAREVAWERAATLLRGVALLGGAVALLALLQVAGFDPLYGAESLRVAVATFGNSNAFAAFAAPALAVAIGLASRERAVLARLAVVLLAAALVVARGRGGWLAGSIGAVAALLVAARTAQRWRHAAGMALLGGALGLLLALASGAGGGAGSGAADDGGARNEAASKPLGLGLERRSNVVRLEVAKATLDVIGDAPLLGHGPGSFRQQFPLHRRAEEAAIATRDGAPSEVDHPHVEWLRLAAEGGWLTAACVALALLGALLAASRGPQVARDDGGALRAASVGGLVAWLIASLTWSTLYDPATALQGALLAGIACAGTDEVATVAPRGSWLARLFATALALACAWFGAPTVAAEWREWRAASTGRIDAEELAAIAALDDSNLERQYATGALFLVQSRAFAAEVGRMPAAAAATATLLEGADTAFGRALVLLPHHVPSLAGAAEVAARRGDLARARLLLRRRLRLEPWRGPFERALAELLEASGRELSAAEQRLALEGDAAIEPLLAQALQLRAEGKNRVAAQLLDLLCARAPEAGELWRHYALAWKDLDDDAAYRRAYRRSQLAFALDALDAGDGEAARGNLKVARRFAPEDAPMDGGVALPEELLEACLELAAGKPDAARERLAALEPAAVAMALAGAGPRLLAALRALRAAPELVVEAERLALPR